MKTKLSIPVITGTILIIISFVIFALPQLQKINVFDELFNISFLLNYIIAWGYLLYIIIRHIINNGWRFLKLNGDQLRIFIILFTISSFSLNRTMHIFAPPVLWLNIYLIICFVALYIYTYRESIQDNFLVIIYFVFGLGFVISIYFSLILLRVSLISIALSWFFGLSLQGVAQLLWIPSFLYPVIKSKHKKFKISFILGIVIPLAFLVYFLFQYQNVNNQINEITNSKSVYPVWVNIGQKLENNSITEKIIKSNIFYETGTIFSGFQIFDSNLNIKQKHEPLVWIATKIFGNLNTDKSTQEKLLQTGYKLRHEFIPAYWRGDNLTTANINCNIEIYPEYRIAYVEKTFSIKNSAINKWWTEDREAIYTFHLPDGGFATSLSLWINGKEEKAVLTSKQKADRAYSTIVGYEMRDPAIATWAEGNRVIVRIFPCTNKEMRKFKLGYTVPLKVNNNNLFYQDDYMEGPDASDAHEKIHIKIMSGSKNLLSDLEFDDFYKAGESEFKYEGKYFDKLKFKIPLPDLSNQAFCFNNKAYFLKQANDKNIPFNTKNVYLDINKSWSQNELVEILNICKDKKTYVYLNEQLKEINLDNYQNIFIKMHELNYSLFPVFIIENNINSLLITKSNCDLPYLSDLKPSLFYDATLQKISSSNNMLNVLCLNDKITGYYKSLSSYEYCNIILGDNNVLKNIINNKTITIKDVKENDIYIPETDIVVSSQNIDNNNFLYKSRCNAPDHLMRLYNYKKILHKTCKLFIDSTKIDISILKRAEEAYVVSPVSSLVVLESKNDYKRFDIEQPGTSESLFNAELNDNGAVPEPHEWMLIIITVLTACFLTLKQQKII